MRLEETVFIHLSDIHFKKMRNGHITDVDDDVRNELLRDVEQQSKGFSSISGILVTGDIAFSGQPDQYQRAEQWLANLCARAGCLADMVWTVPGNHDIDREVIRKSTSIEDRHDKLRRIEVAEIEGQLERYWNDEEARSSFIKPLKAYNDLAKKFECQINPGDFYWEDDLLLNDGSILRLRGLNSTFVSNGSDNDKVDSTKLILSKKQIICQTESGVVYLTLCHHPPDWCRDQDEINDWLDKRVNVQLFGHKHRQRIELADKRVRITSGAANPDTREPNWKPCYNFITISVKNDDGNRQLLVKVQPRIWSDEHKRFVSEDQGNGQAFRVCLFRLEPWLPPLKQAIENLGELEPLATSSASTGSEQSADLPPNSDVKEESVMNLRRRLAYRFYTLPYNVRLRVAQELELVLDEDQDVPDAQLFERYFQRALERQILARFWESVEIEHSDQSNTQNPFSSE